MPPENLDVTGQENILPADKPEPMSVTLDRALTVRESPPPPAEPAADAPSRTEVAAGATGERPRDQFGRFAPPDHKPEGVPATKKGDDGFPTAPATTTTPQPATPAATQEVPAPQSWKPEMQSVWKNIPAPIRTYINQREQELQNGFQTIHQRVEISKAILNEFTPYAAVLEAEGATPVQAIRTLLQTAHALRSAGPEYRKAIVLSLANQYGVDLTQPLNVELAKAQAEAGNLSIERMYQLSGQTNQIQNEVQRQFNAFAADPANEFFPQVRGIMGKMIETGAVTTLKDAYDNAVWLHPEVRKTLLARQNQQTKERTTAANLSVTGAPNGPAAPVTAQKGREGLRKTIESAFQANSGGDAEGRI